ncbi:MAG: hypothetical protein Q4P72_06450, partial [Eubacteriales bacterium]|nr:hypothetical protein [Eubacteriales bacterium]
EGSSLVGDGVASCALSFPDHDDGRARWMIVATDNEPQGESIYDLPKAIELAKSRNVTVFGIYYHDSFGSWDAYSESEAKQQEDEFRKAVESTGGKLFEVSDSNSVDEILDDINSRGATQGKGRVITTERDANQPYIAALFFVVSAIIIFAGVSRQ